jgi:hypothetical protein
VQRGVPVWIGDPKSQVPGPQVTQVDSGAGSEPEILDLEAWELEAGSRKAPDRRPPCSVVAAAPQSAVTRDPPGCWRWNVDMEWGLGEI